MCDISGYGVDRDDLPPLFLGIAHRHPRPAAVGPIVDRQQAGSDTHQTAVALQHTVLVINAAHIGRFIGLPQKGAIPLLRRGGPFAFLALTGQDSAEPDSGTVLFEVQGNLCRPEVHSLGHAREEVRHAPVCQCFHLPGQDLFQQYAVPGGLVVAPGETFGPVARDGASAFVHMVSDPFYYEYKTIVSILISI